jgi:hypothetical protein
MPALESRRVRTQPLTVTAASEGARPARISRVLNCFLCIDRQLQRQSDLSSYCPTVAAAAARGNRLGALSFHPTLPVASPFQTLAARLDYPLTQTAV